MRVSWVKQSLDRLADFYVTLDLDRQDKIAKIVAEINSKLAKAPWSVGESRATDDQRSWHVEPLTVFPDKGLVLVQHLATKRPKQN